MQRHQQDDDNCPYSKEEGIARAYSSNRDAWYGVDEYNGKFSKWYSRPVDKQTNYPDRGHVDKQTNYPERGPKAIVPPYVNRPGTNKSTEEQRAEFQSFTNLKFEVDELRKLLRREHNEFNAELKNLNQEITKIKETIENF